MSIWKWTTHGFIAKTENLNLMHCWVIMSRLHSNSNNHHYLRYQEKACFVLFCFLGLHLQHMEFPYFPGRESNQSYSCRSTPQQQHCRIWATSATNTTVWRNVRSLTHWARPRIQPTATWILVRFISSAPQEELPRKFWL